MIKQLMDAIAVFGVEMIRRASSGYIYIGKFTGTYTSMSLGVAESAKISQQIKASQV